MITNNTAYKYETPYKVPFLIKKCWTNGTVSLQCGAIKNMYNIYHINPYKSDTNVQDINPKNMCDNVKILFTSYIPMSRY